MHNISNTHDLDISDWGPYSKKYAGISHISNKELGLRFDLSVFPGQYRRKTEVPNCMFESNYHIKEASSDLSYFSTSHQIEWKDKLYTDISYSRLDDNCYIINAHSVNNTNSKQNLVLHLMASMQYPSLDEKFNQTWISTIEYNLPKNSAILHAIDFDYFEHKIERPKDSLVTDGLRRGEIRTNGFYRGSAVQIGEFLGDTIHYSLPKFTCEKPILTIRAKNTSNTDVTLTFSGAINGNVTILANCDINLFKCLVNFNLDKDKFTVSASHDGVLLDSFLIHGETDTVSVQDLGIEHKPLAWEHCSDTAINFEKDTSLNLQKSQDEIVSANDNILILKYRDSEFYYGIAWDYEDFDIRYILNDELDLYLKVMAHDHVNKVLKRNERGTFANVFMRPIPVNPNENKDIFAVVACGLSKKEVENKLKTILLDTSIMPKTCKVRHDEIYKTKTNKSGEKFHFSQNIMSATTLMNIVYPVYTRRSFIRHNTPGKWWDSLYTWDSGFVGLGLSACDIDRAIDCLNAYLTDVGDLENAFIHHGTPIPVQFYLFQEIYNLTQSKKLAKDCYPRLRQYYLFLAGKLGSSNTTKTQSNMVNTFSYFYNSGGWDDYPPQVYVHKNKLAQTVCPVAGTAHVIRCSKILKQIAFILPEFRSDLSEYDNDIKKFTESLQKYSWDEKAGYFSFVCHDENKKFTGILKHETGENFNRGLDGMTPLIAGATTNEQSIQIEKNLMNQNKHFTAIGLSTVDKSAPYYKKDGYWNGAVWMPHQWFFSKALLDYGYADDAYKIAKTALETWENEVSESYNCFEHFLIESGRGAGWHHFSGLSTPVLLWQQTYYKKGKITCGHSGIIISKEYDEKNSTMSANIHFVDASEKTTVIVVMPENRNYIVTKNGEKINFNLRDNSALELNFSVKQDEIVKLEIKSHIC